MYRKRKQSSQVTRTKRIFTCQTNIYAKPEQYPKYFRLYCVIHSTRAKQKRLQMLKNTHYIAWTVHEKANYYDCHTACKVSYL